MFKQKFRNTVHTFPCMYVFLFVSNTKRFKLKRYVLDDLCSFQQFVKEMLQERDIFHCVDTLADFVSMKKVAYVRIYTE